MAITPNGRMADASGLGKGPRRLSDYEREIAHALIRKGHSKRDAIKMARGLLKKAAATGRWGNHGKAGAKTRAGAAASIAQRKDFSNPIDLAGFNPSEARAAGKWTKGGAASAKTKPKGKITATDINGRAMLAQRAALRAEVKHLTAKLARIRAGAHSGAPAAGVHKGQATGKHSGPAKGGKTKAPAASSGPSAGPGKGLGLAGQIAHLKKQVAHLKLAIIRAQVH